MIWHLNLRVHNKVSLEPSHTHLLTYLPWLLSQQRQTIWPVNLQDLRLSPSQNDCQAEKFQFPVDSEDHGCVYLVISIGAPHFGSICIICLNKNVSFKKKKTTYYCELKDVKKDIRHSCFKNWTCRTLVFEKPASEPGFDLWQRVQTMADQRENLQRWTWASHSEKVPEN